MTNLATPIVAKLVRGYRNRGPSGWIWKGGVKAGGQTWLKVQTLEGTKGRVGVAYPSRESLGRLLFLARLSTDLLTLNLLTLDIVDPLTFYINEYKVINYIIKVAVLKYLLYKYSLL